MTPRLVVETRETTAGRGCRWFYVQVEDTRKSKVVRPDGSEWINTEAFYGAHAVQLDDGRVSVFEVWRCGHQRLRRDAAIKREIENAVKLHLGAK